MRSVTRALLTVGLLSACVVSGEARANFVALDLSPYYNSTAGNYINGTTYPTGNQTYGGVPFIMPASAAANAPYAWNANFAAGANPRVLEIAVGVFGVDVAYTIMNTFWGQAQSGLIAVEFVGSDTAFQSFDLVGNNQIRDYNQAVWTNSINGTTTTQAFSNGLGQRLDRQMYDLSDDFLDETLDLIRIIDNGAVNFSRAFIVAATVQQIPEPSAALMLGLGLVVTAGAARRLRRTA